MMTLSLSAMRGYLSTSLSSVNDNKMRGLLAEIEFRKHLATLDFGHRVSAGGWVARSTGAGNFSHRTIVIFPDVVPSGSDLSASRSLPQPPLGLHTICATFRQLGIESYFCVPLLDTNDDAMSLSWKSRELGIPWDDGYRDFPGELAGFEKRTRRYNYLRYRSDASRIADPYVSEEFFKENLRVCLNNPYLAEISDLDGVLWGKQFTYPVEIKEKTAAKDSRMGAYFGLDVGPFVKLAYYAAKKRNLHALFVVREIDDQRSRNLVEWRYITFDRLAQFASWTPVSGGTGMTGGSSSVVKIPKSEFGILNKAALEGL